MEWLNYHHFLYFWMVAKEGSIVRASKELRLAHPTISGQIHRLEEVLGEKLLIRKGRNLALTETGRMAFRYADEIFSLGREFQDALKGQGGGMQTRLAVGVSDVLAKSIVHKILAPAFALKDPVRVSCRENRSVKAFMADLATHEIDIILADAPAGPGTSVKAFNHLLGECGVSFFASRTLAKTIRRGFPRSLSGAPFLLPGGDSTFRRLLNEWFAELDIVPKVIAELDDAALISVFGEQGLGVFAAPDVIDDEIVKRYNVVRVGHAPLIRQRFYAISAERKIKNPAVLAICERARKQIFT